MTRHATGDPNPPIRRLREVAVYGNRFVTIYDDPVLFRDGTEGRYLRIVESAGRPGVAILPFCDNQVALVRTYRYAVESLEWGVPRGFAHDADPVTSARAELAEELGGDPDELVPIGTVTPNSGLLATRVELFFARYATRVDNPKDRDEIMSVEWVSVRDLHDRIASGEMTDAFTLSALMCAEARGLMRLR